MSGERSQAYRRLHSLTQEEMAARLGLERSRVGGAELGRQTTDGWPVDRIGFSHDRFDELPAMSEPLHRALARTRKGDQYRAREIVRLGGEIYGLLSRTNRTYPCRLERIGPVSPDDFDQVAEELRCAVLDQEMDAPIRNLTAAAEKAGIVIVPVPGLDGVSGLSSWVRVDDRDIPVVGLDPKLPGDRFRLTILHELTHLAVHRQRTENSEHEANQIARMTLIPDHRIVELFNETRPTMRDFVSMKKHWGVSVAALIYGAHELGLIDDGRYRSLQVQMSGWKRIEPARFDPVHGKLLGMLIEKAGGLSVVSAQLGLPMHDVALVTNWRHLRGL